MSGQQPSVVVIGAGPVGLAAAAHLLERGLEPLVLERGDDVATNVADWAHVRVFSPWSFNVDDAALRLLEPLGWEAPDPEHHPTGGELVEGYLRPLAATPALGARIRFGARVMQVTRAGFDKMKTDGREAAPFQVFVETDAGEERIAAVAVVDASGTYATPNPLGAGGVAALGERGLAHRIEYRIPDVLGAQRSRYAGRRVLVGRGGGRRCGGRGRPRDRPLRRGHRCDRLPPGSRHRSGAAARPGQHGREPHRAGAADRPEHPQLRKRAAARRAGAGPPRARLLHRWHEELRPRAHLPATHRLRAGALRRSGAGGRHGGGRAGRAHASRD